jgi:uncharacterized protein involved in exopolysaccharide biosynthesis
MILGTARLDTVYNFVAEKLKLPDYYGMDKNDGEANQKAASILKSRTKSNKSDYGELKIKVRDGDRHQAATMANSIMEKLQQIHQDIQTSRNSLVLSKIKEEYAGRQIQYQMLNDSLSRTTMTAGAAQILSAKQNSLIKQIEEYEKLISQYELMVKARPQALVVVERANPPLWPDSPKPLQFLMAAAFISLLFGLFTALILERRRMMNRDE